MIQNIEISLIYFWHCLKICINLHLLKHQNSMTIFTYVLNRIQNSLVSSLLCSIFSLFKMFSPCGWYVCDNITHCVVTEHFIVWLSLRFRKDNKIWYDSVKKNKWSKKKSLFDCFTLSHCFFIIWWKELNSMPKYAIWKCKLHLNDDSNFFSWPFDFSSSFSCQLFDIFAHFFPCYLFKTICFFYLRSFFFSLQKVVVCLLQKKRMHQVENCKENH